MVWRCPPLHLPNWNNLWKWKEEMNANELADDAKNISNAIEALEWVQKAVPMLRQFGLAESIIKQQQLKIDNLYENNARLDAEIDALKTQPVNPYQSITDTKIEPTVVSYTRPVKEHFEDEPQAEELHEIMQSNLELTDEEIEEVTNTIEWRGSDWLWELDFARAILRKAQEK